MCKLAGQKGRPFGLRILKRSQVNQIEVRQSALEIGRIPDELRTDVQFVALQDERSGPNRRIRGGELTRLLHHFGSKDLHPRQRQILDLRDVRLLQI